MARTPIERMIDEACGVPDGWVPTPQKDWILLCCPRCKRSLTVQRTPDDPSRATRLELCCPACISQDVSDSHTQRWFDAAGHLLREALFGFEP